MARARKKKVELESAWEPSEFLKSIQLTPDQKAELRSQTMKEVERARASGVYQRLIDLHEKRVRERANPSMLRDGEPRKK